MTDQNEDFVSFEKALRDLSMQSEELKKLVSEGEIRAFRDGQSMKFKREDVEGLVGGRGGDDELEFADVLEDDTGMVTEEFTEEETLLAEDDLLEDEPVVAAAPAASPARQLRRSAPRSPGRGRAGARADVGHRDRDRRRSDHGLRPDGDLQHRRRSDAQRDHRHLRQVARVDRIPGAAGSARSRLWRSRASRAFETA